MTDTTLITARVAWAHSQGLVLPPPDGPFPPLPRHVIPWPQWAEAHGLCPITDAETRVIEVSGALIPVCRDSKVWSGLAWAGAVGQCTARAQ